MTKLRANQIEIQEVLNDPAAQATEVINGTLRIATQAEVDGGSPYDHTIVITPETLGNFGVLTSHISAINPHNGWMSVNNDADTSGNTSGGGGVSIGTNCIVTTTGVTLSTVAIGSTITTNTAASNSVALGNSITVDESRQVVIGDTISSTAVTTDVFNSVKLGYGGSNSNKNMLHLFSKGKFELYGDEAQFIFPNYEPAGSPATLPVPSTTLEGGTVYSIDEKTLKFYNGTAWTALNADNWLHANNGSDFTTTPSGTGTDSIALGNNASTSTAYGAIAIGTNVTAAINAVSIGPNSDALGTSSVAIGTYAQTSASGTGVAIGPNANAAGTGSIAIGFLSSTLAQKSIAIGYDSDTAALTNQIAIGNSCKSASVTTDVTYSVKIGEGLTGTAKNMLHLFSKGKLELYGDEAQFIFPNYQSGSPGTPIPSTTNEGGAIWDSTTKELKIYDDTAFIGVSDIAINAQTGTAYTLAITDKNTLVTMDNAAANTLTIPTNASVAFPVGTQILLEQEGAGTTTITSAGSPAVPTIHSAGSLFDTASQYTTISLIKKATDTWLIVGDLA